MNQCCIWDDDGRLVQLCAEHDITKRGELLACGCRREQTYEHDLILIACDVHVGPWRDFEHAVRAKLDYEIDETIREFSGRRSVKQPYDPRRAVGIFR